jgi:hypothetical protein
MTKRCVFIGVCLAILGGLFSHTSVLAQVVINELVINERDYAGNLADTREFVELYNAGASPVNLDGWRLRTWNLSNGTQGTFHTLQNVNLAPGDYYVLGPTEVANVDQVLPSFTDIWTDGTPLVLELQNSSLSTVDAVAFEVYRTAATGLANATASQLAQIGSGYQGQLFSFNVGSPNVMTSWSRYRDGVDTNRNGLDFGNLPLTPGASNNLPIKSKYTAPNVDLRAWGSEVEEYHASFVLPRVIDPTVVDGSNPRTLPASPQKGNAITAWDPAGGGNTAYSHELVTSFDIWAYIDTAALGLPLTGQQYEISTYGIGTSDGRFAIANPLGNVTGTGTPITENANTGLGWYLEQWQNGASNSSKLLLVDFGDGGNSAQSAAQWKIKQTIDLIGMTPGWYRLGIDYDPSSGNVVARFGANTYAFTTDPNLLGTFYAGWREVIANQGSHLPLLNPPVFDNVSPAGDYDADGDVDADDYTVWRSAFGQTVSPAGSGADGNIDGKVDAADYTIWRQHVMGSGALSGQQVPEPCSVASIGLMFVISSLAVRTRQRSA